MSQQKWSRISRVFLPKPGNLLAIDGVTQGRPGCYGERLLADLANEGLCRVDDHVELIPALRTADEAAASQEDGGNLAGFQGAEGFPATEDGRRPGGTICAVWRS